MESIAEALVAVQETGERGWEAELYRLKGEWVLHARHQAPEPGGDMTHIAGHTRRTAAAEACLQQALAIARGQQAKALELRAAMSLSRLW
jgi:predicted ATPase